ncbi:hypothetical protein FRC03_009756 [Tulasnella sp. 419]|nr:hypothetical protein FRC03_009756 [Tulasnella sp. 419]
MAPRTPPGPHLTIPARTLNTPNVVSAPVDRFHEYPSGRTFSQDQYQSHPTHTKPERSNRPSAQETHSDDSRSRRVPNTSIQTSIIYKRVIANRVVLAILVAWTTYTGTRYFIAFSDAHQVPLRRAYSLAFGTLSSISFLGNVFVFMFSIVRTFQSARLQQVVVGISSITIICPALINLILVATSRSTEDPNSWMSLRGRCLWDIDVVWQGQSGQCYPGVFWGAWLAGAISRLVLTIVFIALAHLLTYLSLNLAKPPISRRSPSQTALVAPSTATTISSPVFPYSHGSPVTAQESHRTGSQPQLPLALRRPSLAQSRTSGSIHDHNGTLRSSQDGSEANHTATSTLTPSNYRARYTPSQLNPSSTQGEWGYQGSSPVEGTDGATNSTRQLQQIAANFQNATHQVSRETEDGMRLPDPRDPGRSMDNPYLAQFRRRDGNLQPTPSPSSSSSSSPQRYYTPAQELSQPQIDPSNIQSLDSSDEYDSHSDSEIQQHREQFIIQEQHNVMVMEQALREEGYEHVVVMGGVVRRMSTILSLGGGSSIGDRDPWTPTPGSAQMGISRSPTMSTTRSGVLGHQQTVHPSLSRRNSAPTTSGGSGGNGSDRSRTESPSALAVASLATGQSSSSVESSPKRPKKNTM